MEYIYITTGTEDYLKPIIKNNPDRKIYLLQNYDYSLLLEESSKEPVFKEANTYRRLQCSGEIEGHGTVSFEYVLVRDEEVPILFVAYRHLSQSLTNIPGLQRIELGQSLKANKFLVLSFWDSPAEYQNYNQSIVHKQIEKIMADNHSQIGFSHVDTFHFPKYSH